MTPELNRAKAQLNLRLYPIIKIFVKRVYIPLVAIYFVNVSGLELAEVGFLGAFVAAITLLSEIPTGYISDKFSRRYSMLIAGALGMIGVSIFILFQNKTGVFVGTFFETLAYAFISGTGQALVHDSLAVLGREADYSKYTSRTQSLSLVANAMLIALVPLSYSIDPRLPFVAGFVQFMIIFVTSWFLTDVKHFESHDIQKPINLKWIRNNKAFLAFALSFGVVAATYIAPKDFVSLAFEAYGANPAYFGLIFSASSVLGAILGVFMYKLKDIGATKYAVLDAGILTLAFTAFSSGNNYIAIPAFILTMGFWRYRGIIYEDYVYQIYKTKYKATLLSILYNAEQINRVWLPFVIGLLVGVYGLQSSFLFIAGFGAAASLPFVLIARKTLEK